MKQPVPLQYNKYYHIYNRGINSENLFRENSNFERFHFKHRRVFQTPTGLKETAESNPSVWAAPDGV
jgi:hypothetical protein